MKALYLFFVCSVYAREVRVEITQAASSGEPVSKQHKYDCQVTLYVESKDGTLTPSGWSTRKDQGGNGAPFAFTPGQGLIEGWTEGVLKMKIGERAKIHVPAAKGYGAKAMGKQGGGWYIPANSDLMFDIEIVGKHGQ